MISAKTSKLYNLGFNGTNLFNYIMSHHNTNLQYGDSLGDINVIKNYIVSLVGMVTNEYINEANILLDTMLPFEIKWSLQNKKYKTVDELKTDILKFI